MKREHVAILSTNNVFLDAVAMLQANLNKAFFLLLRLLTKDTELQLFVIF